MESITSDNRFVGKEKAYRWKQQISVKHVKEKKLYRLEKGLLPTQSNLTLRNTSKKRSQRKLTHDLVHPKKKEY